VKQKEEEYKKIKHDYLDDEKKNGQTPGVTSHTLIIVVLILVFLMIVSFIVYRIVKRKRKLILAKNG
jgi:hypothetical protein